MKKYFNLFLYYVYIFKIINSNLFSYVATYFVFYN
jgi:hypothetical protein